MKVELKLQINIGVSGLTREQQIRIKNEIGQMMVDNDMLIDLIGEYMLDEFEKKVEVEIIVGTNGGCKP